MYQQIQSYPTPQLFVTAGEGGGGGGGGVAPATGASAWWKFEETGVFRNSINTNGGALRADAVSGSSDFALMETTSPGDTAQEWNSTASGKIGNGAASPTATDLTNCSLIIRGPSTFSHTAGNSISFSYWLKIQDAIGESFNMPGVIFRRGAVASALTIEGYEFNGDSYLAITTYNGSTDDYVEAVWNYTPGDWYLVTFVYDAATGLAHLYLNEALFLSTTVPVNFAGTDSIIPTVANADSPFPVYFVDEFALWLTYALTSENVAFLFNGGTGRTYPYA